MARLKKATVRLEYVDKQVTATCVEDPSLETRAPNSRSAKMKISNKIGDKHGGIEITYVFVLPPEVQKSFDELQAEERQLRALSESIPKHRIQLSIDIQACGFTQTDTAEILGVSQSGLAMATKRDAEGMPTKTSTNRRPTS